MKFQFIALTILTTLISTSSFAQSCKEEIGLDAAKSEVSFCLAVSPSTHPPCNVENSCEMIQNEIIRGCKLLKGSDDYLSECDQYLN